MSDVKNAPKPIPAHVIELDKSLKDLTGHVERQQGVLNYQQVVIDALVTLMGPETVQDTIDARHVERLKPIAEAQKANAIKAVEDGRLIPTETATENSIIIAVERNARNSITHLRAQLALAVMPHLQSAMVGKVAGDTVMVIDEQTKNTVSYEILEIYEPGETTAVEVSK